MVNNSRRNAGLQTSRKSSKNSLVNYLMKDGVAGSRLAAINANSNLESRTEKANAAKLQSSSRMLMEQTRLLGDKVDNASTSMTNTARSLVDSFNETGKNLKKVSGVLNDYYRQTMRDLALDNKSALAEIGITVSSDGTLSLNQETFEAADGEKVKKLLGSEGEFMKRLSFVASRVFDSAGASVESASSRYNSSGNLTNSYLSKYNFRG